MSFQSWLTLVCDECGETLGLIDNQFPPDKYFCNVDCADNFDKANSDDH